MSPQANFIGTFGHYEQAPPYRFSNVTVQEFVVRARESKLERLCDRYLNFVPNAKWGAQTGEVAITLAHYGKMQGAGGMPGYTTQTELTFRFIVKSTAGRTDWGWFSPYLIVDNPFSLISGREVAGYPKALGRFEFDQPSLPVTQGAVYTGVFADTSQNAKFEERKIFEILPAADVGPTPAADKSHLTRFPFRARGSRARGATRIRTPAKDGDVESEFVDFFIDADVDALQFREIRDYEDPSKASYRGVNFGVYRLTNPDNAIVGAALSPTPRIKIHSYPSLDLVSEFGLYTDGDGCLFIEECGWSRFDFDLTDAAVLHSDA